MEYRPLESSNASCILQGEFYTCPEGRGMKYPNHKTGRHTTTFIKAWCTIVMVSWRLHAASRWGIPTDTRWIPGGGMAHSGTATSRFCQVFWAIWILGSGGSPGIKAACLLFEKQREYSAVTFSTSFPSPIWNQELKHGPIISPRMDVFAEECCRWLQFNISLNT
jgi:hypothetical protein